MIVAMILQKTVMNQLISIAKPPEAPSTALHLADAFHFMQPPNMFNG